MRGAVERSTRKDREDHPIRLSLSCTHLEPFHRICDERVRDVPHVPSFELLGRVKAGIQEAGRVLENHIPSGEKHVPHA